MEKAIYQTQFNSCLACVLAMIVGETEQYVINWFKNQNPPFNDEDAMIFLAHHGIFFALSGKFNGEKNFYPDTTIKIHFELEGRCAYIVVESKTSKTGYHAIFWNGSKVLDPQRLNDKRRLEDYKIHYIYPLQVTEERAKFFELIKNSH